MTVTLNPSRNEYTATAGQTVFSYTFKIYTDTDLNVYITPSGQDPDDTNDLTTAYTVAGVGIDTGGSITLDTGTNDGDTVVIISDIPTNRTVDYQTNGDFIPSTVNNDIDRTVSLVKQFEGQVDRSLRFTDAGSSDQDTTIPPIEAGSAYIGNPAGTALITASIDTLTISTPYVDTYSELRDVDTTDIRLINVGGRDSLGDNGDGVFTFSPSDLSTEVALDSLSGVYVAPSSDLTGASGAWVRQGSSEGIDVGWYGASPSNANNSAAVQAAYDFALANDIGKITCPGGVYQFVETLEFIGSRYNVWGSRDEITIWNNATNNLIDIGGSHIGFFDIRLATGYDGTTGGHVVNQVGNCSHVFIFRSSLSTTVATSNLWVNNGFNYLDNRVDNTWLELTAAHTVPGWHLTSAAGNVNQNSWSNMRATFSGAYVFYIDGDGGVAQGNHFEDINFEQANGGAIRLGSCFGSRIVNCDSYDAQLGGTINSSFISLEADSGAVGECKFIEIHNSNRHGGTLGAGVFDIEVIEASRTLITGGFTSGGSAYSVEAKANSLTLVNTDWTLNDPTTPFIKLFDGLVVGPESGITQTSVVPKNIRGNKVSTNDAATDILVTFPTAEDDGDYFIQCTPTADTGTPPAGTKSFRIIDKFSTRFTISMDEAPGTGNTVSFDWFLMR